MRNLLVSMLRIVAWLMTVEVVTSFSTFWPSTTLLSWLFSM